MTSLSELIVFFSHGRAATLEQAVDAANNAASKTPEHYRPHFECVIRWPRVVREPGYDWYWSIKKESINV